MSAGPQINRSMKELRNDTDEFHDKKPLIDRAAKGQEVLALQGGGALGAYQGVVFQALDEAGIEPDWAVGTSIGAINAAIIAGNAQENSLEKLRVFWHRVQPDAMTALMGSLPMFGALPLAFPSIKIDGEFYWDGGIISNTPAEAVFDDNPR